MNSNKEVTLLNLLQNQLLPLAVKLKEQLLLEAECLRKLDNNVFIETVKAKQNTVTELTRVEKEFFKLINYDNKSPLTLFFPNYIKQSCAPEHHQKLIEAWLTCRQKLQTAMRQNNINGNVIAKNLERAENRLQLFKPNTLEAITYDAQGNFS